MGRAIKLGATITNPSVRPLPPPVGVGGYFRRHRAETFTSAADYWYEEVAGVEDAYPEGPAGITDTLAGTVKVVRCTNDAGGPSRFRPPVPSAGQPYTVLMVWRCPSGSGNTDVLNLAGRKLTRHTTNGLVVQSNAAGGPDALVVAHNWSVQTDLAVMTLALSADGSADAIEIAGGIVGTDSGVVSVSSPTAVPPFAFGSSATNGIFEIAEIVIWQEILSPEDRTTVREAAAARYALTI